MSRRARQPGHLLHRTGCESRRTRIIRSAAQLAIAALCLIPLSCQTPTPRSVELPERHSVRSEQLLVLSDFKLPKDHALIRDLEDLRDDVAQTLQLPVQQNQVIVYLFSDEKSYREYIRAAFPGLPDRRAYFVVTSHDLAVYTYWGDRIQEDLRHEYTHGILHASLKHVPLWLDEGLAEYFEVVPTEPERVNSNYVERLSEMHASGWQPKMERLEQIEKFADMRLPEYQESWAWVHYMLNSTPEARQALLSYIADLQENRSPPRISARLNRQVPDYGREFIDHVAALQTARVRVGMR